MRFRKLRIAISTVCGIFCVLPIALWVRSYWWQDNLCAPHGDADGMELTSHAGRLHLYWGFIGFESNEWLFFSSDIETAVTNDSLEDPTRMWKLFSDDATLFISIPHRSIVVMIAAIAAIAWLRWRFSLRTLIIATTLAAVALGAIVLAARK